MSVKSSRCALVATRAEAEDLAAMVDIDYEELPANHDMLQARSPDAALIHEDWSENSFLESFVDVGDIEAIATQGVDQGRARIPHRPANVGVCRR